MYNTSDNTGHTVLQNTAVEKQPHSSSIAKQQLAISAGGFSTAGAKEFNQDAFALKINKGLGLDLKGHVAAIADGVSSANFAAQASQMSVCHFIEEYLATPQSWSVNKSAEKVLSALNSWLYSRMLTKTVEQTEQQWFSTFSAIVFKNTQAHIFHVGDCQIAKLNNEGYQVLTKEHSTPSGILNRAMGAANNVKVDLSICDIETHDIFILSCDGVYNFVKKKQIQDIIGEIDDLEQASAEITRKAQENGSKDNLTCLLIKIKHAPAIGFNQLIAQRRQQAIPPALHAGAVLDQYQILEIKQQTARSHIYLAYDRKKERQVIIKAPSLNFFDDDDYLNNFIKEGWIGEKFNHHSLMRIYPQTIRSQFLYHVCEFIEGSTLDSWMKDNPNPEPALVIDYIKKMVSALRVLQRMDVIHSDLKPDNFMLDKNNAIKLIDYGSCDIGSFSHKNPNIVLGTLSYSAPEVLKGEVASFKSDMFSLAVIIYQMLCQNMPFKSIHSQNDIPKFYSHWHYRPIAIFRSDLPSNIDSVLQHALQANPNKRIESYSEFVEGFKDQTNHHHSLLNHSSKHRPFIESNPLRFWQYTSASLFVLLVLSLVF